jgi:hypothetical protein
MRKRATLASTPPRSAGAERITACSASSAHTRSCPSAWAVYLFDEKRAEQKHGLTRVPFSQL